MSIFFLFIPLIIFIAAEAVILYFLISLIASGLTEYDFSAAALIDGAYSARTAIAVVFVYHL